MTKALNAFDIIQMTYYFHFRFSQQEGVNMNPKRKKEKNHHLEIGGLY